MASKSSDPRLNGTGRNAAPAVVPSGVRVAAEWSWRLGVIAIGIYLVSRIFARFADVFIPVMVALLLAALLAPVVTRLTGGIPRGLAALVTLLGTLLLVVGLFALVGQQAVSGFPDLRTQAGDGLTQIQGWLSTGPLHLSASTISGYSDNLGEALQAHQSTILSGALGVASTATTVITGFFITMFSTFFFLAQGQAIWAWLLRILPTAAREPLDDAARSGWVTLGHYIRATLIVAVVDGLGVGLGVAILGVPLALPLGVVVFLGAFIPVVGATLTGVLAILVALVAKGPVIALVVLGIVVLVNQLEAHVLQPFLLGRAVSVHPLAVILAIVTGALLAGIVGALFAVPVVAVANTMITSLVGRGEDPGERIAEADAPLAPDMPVSTDPDPADIQHRPSTSDLNGTKPGQVPTRGPGRTDSGRSQPGDA
ncbi:MAG: AI-2E family transporter [Propionibacteriales bacterium]|nr:AI-2E family transporter [Propionibacteriales bacterium]